VPGSPLEAVMSGEVWQETYKRLVELIESHRTTLIFVNTRRLSERMAFQLSERLGAEHVAAHHGSLAKEARLEAEARLREGRLKVLVATASLELGIDIGHVDLVCQISSPHRIATLLQRVGPLGPHGERPAQGPRLPAHPRRSGRMRGNGARGEGRRARPRAHSGQAARRARAADRRRIRRRGMDEDALFELVRGAYPYRGLEKSEFDEVVAMLAKLSPGASDGGRSFTTELPLEHAEAATTGAPRDMIAIMSAGRSRGVRLRVSTSASNSSGRCWMASALRHQLGDDLVELGLFETAVRVSAADEFEQRILVPFLGGGFGDDLLREHVERLVRNEHAVELAVLHRAHHCRAFDQIVAGEREDAALGQAAHRVARAADALKKRRDAVRRGDLTDEIDWPIVDAQLERRSCDQHLNRPSRNLASASRRASLARLP